MILRCLALFLYFGLIGCASIETLQLSQKYTTIYYNALDSDDVTSISKHENYQKLKRQLSNYITSYGYTKVIFVNPKQGFIVLAKKENIHPSRIILKYTGTAGVDRISIDLVRASDDLSTDSEVSKDIQGIAEHIKNE